ncbi:hypothetical protein AgCh_029285 [Apium graveolens]
MTDRNGNDGDIALSVLEDNMHEPSGDHSSDGCFVTLPFIQKDKVVTLPGVAMVWGLAVMVMIYSIGHISGAHINPAVTIAFASVKRFPWKHVPAYVAAQIIGATLASETIRLIFQGTKDISPGTFPTGTNLQSLVLEFIITFFLMFVISGVATDNRAVPAYVAAQIIGATLASETIRLIFQGTKDISPGTFPTGTNLQSLVLEFIITFFLMFVISGVATDNRAIGELAGLAIGAIVLLNVIIAGPITGASMNPARSLGPVLVTSRYDGIWIYLLGPIAGAISGAWIYNIMRFTNKPLREITKNASFLTRISPRK